MNTLDAIAARRSIRRFKETPVSEEMLRCILSAGIQSPSAKNKQPWRFVVVQGDQRKEMLRVMREGIAHAKEGGEDLGSSEHSANVMEQAPVTIFVIHPHGAPPWETHNVGQMFDDVVDLQSTGAAIQNMLLAAQDLGLGSLWICDVFYAYTDLMQWLGEEGELVAAVAVGYADVAPPARWRKPFDEVVRFVGG